MTAILLGLPALGLIFSPNFNGFLEVFIVFLIGTTIIFIADILGLMILWNNYRKRSTVLKKYESNINVFKKYLHYIVIGKYNRKL